MDLMFAYDFKMKNKCSMNCQFGKCRSKLVQFILDDLKTFVLHLFV